MTDTASSRIRADRLEELQPLGEAATLLGVGLSLVDSDMKVCWRNRLADEWFGALSCGEEHCFARHWGLSERCADCLPVLVFRSWEPREGLRVRGRPGEPQAAYRVAALPVEGSDGRRRWVLETMVQLRGLGRFTGLQAGLQEALAHGTSASAAVLLVADIQGRIVSWPPPATTLFGYELDEILGKRIDLLVPGERRHEQAELLDRVREQDHVARFETVRLTKDGRLAPVALTASALRDEAGELIGLSMLFEDLSELRSLREQLDAQAQLLGRLALRSEKLAVVGSLAAGLAHEIGTPLNVISATAEYLLLDQPGEGGCARELAAIVDETERIGGLVRQLLTFARETPSANVPVRLDDVVTRAVSLVRIPLEKKGVRLEADLPDDLPSVMGDPDGLHQVLVNVLLNAAAAVPENGRIRIVGARRPGAEPEAVLEVHDDGPGVPPELRERVFDPFFTTRPEGTGLGLAVCARIVQSHRGDLHIDSSPLGGARVVLHLPGFREVEP